MQEGAHDSHAQVKIQLAPVRIVVVHCYIGLGSNLGDRKRHLQTGLDGLARHGLPPQAVSSVWESEPVDTQDPRWFWNMAVQVDGDGDPMDLLRTLQRIENGAGRVRGPRNGPRTLDLDLLLMGDLRRDEPELRLPHPRMWSRRFVLEPLAEIARRLVNPLTGRSIDEERRRLRGGEAVRRLGRL